ncbi:hypothetical protein [Lactobacillus iners]|uniref:hypothetical protein n=3 Tax=Bacteria TaxID=2 RepID=UPI001F49CFFE|nr:hypothetical protein [Lactobacillus iners]
MEQDITPKLWESIQKTFWANLKQITKGKSYKDADNYADLVGQAMAKAFHDNAVNLPNDKMYFNIADRLIKGALKQSHELVANYTANVQTALNRQAGLGIKGIKANMDEVKVKNLVEVACNAERYSEVAPKVEQAMTSFARSVVADTMKKNVELHYKLGLSPKIVRKLGRGSSKKRSTSGADCEFCTERVGTFHYNKDNINKGIFSRHAHCTCTLEYFPGNGKKQNSWSKRWENVNNKKEERFNHYQLAMSKKHGKKIYITDQAIEKVQYVDIPGYSEVENITIQSAHKQLLKDAQQNNKSNEVMYILNNKSPVAVYGDRITVEPDKSSAVRYLLNSSADRTLTVLHNHPGQSSFSANDLSFFMTNQSVKTLTIVTNQGKVMYLTKVSGYDYVKARNLAKTVELKDGNYDEYVAKVIKRMYDGGVESKIR